MRIAIICVPTGRSVSTLNDCGCTGRRCSGGRGGSGLERMTPNSSRTSRSVASGSTSPTMIRIALLGAYQAS